MKTKGVRNALAAVYNMPLATEEHFRNKTDMPNEVDPSLLRVSTDSNVRHQLISKGYAHSIQSPIGRDGYKSILHVYPDGGAPETLKKGERIRKNSESVYSGSYKNTKRLPTLDDLKAIITRVDAVEGHLARELSMKTEAEMLQLQAKIASATVNEIYALSSELAEIAKKRENARLYVREEALRNVQRDPDFLQRDFISLIAV
jgi:hypothetical protein